MRGTLSLQECLTKALPKGCQFTLHHLSTPPSPCSAIFAAPPGQKPDETYCESQILSVSINHKGHLLQVFAIEVLVYTTRYLTTLFVSKADSTGCLHLLDLPRGTSSPLKTFATVFLQFLIRERERPDRRLVLSLFARAQNQYLFPASVENDHKHILDDCGLIKWWCRVVDPIIGKFTADNGTSKRNDWSGKSAMGYLRVPGFDTFGTKTFFPKNAIGRSNVVDRWKVADPLQELARMPDLPERCLIPRFPDDPKARFVVTLDDEVPDEVTENLLSASPNEIVDKAHSGRWRSIKSLDQFWEAMSFRQECSSGRLVGFLWAVFTPCEFQVQLRDLKLELKVDKISNTALPTPLHSQHHCSDHLATTSPLPVSPPPEAPTTPPQSSQAAQGPPTPTPVKIRENQVMDQQPEVTEHYFWPTSSRGEVILRQKDYDRVGRLLFRLDYANEDVVAESTREWVDNIAERGGIKNWGKIVVGGKEVPIATQTVPSNDGSIANMLGAGVIRKKKRPAEGERTQ
ncbi:MAG: hypothetical protein Q9164_006102, partial [Protoblastenia rupestris]